MTKSVKYLTHYSSCKDIFSKRKLYSFHKSRFYLNVFLAGSAADVFTAMAFMNLMMPWIFFQRFL